MYTGLYIYIQIHQDRCKYRVSHRDASTIASIALAALPTMRLAAELEEAAAAVAVEEAAVVVVAAATPPAASLGGGTGTTCVFPSASSRRVHGAEACRRSVTAEPAISKALTRHPPRC